MQFPSNRVDNGYVSSGFLAFPLTNRLPVNGSFYNDLVHSFKTQIEKNGDWLWLKDYCTGDTFMASEFEPLSKKFAVVLKEHGLKRGDFVHTVVGNVQGVFAAMGGTWLLGGRVSGGDVALDSKAIAGQLDTIGAKFILCHPKVADKALKAASERTDPTAPLKVFSMGEAPGCINILPLVQEADEAEAPKPEVFTEDEMKKDTFHVFWSSGTTGLPKGIAHSQYSVLNWAGPTKTLGKEGITYASTTAFYHVGGFINCVNAVPLRRSFWHAGYDGATIPQMLSCMAESKCVSMQMGSHQYVGLAESEELQAFDSNKLAGVMRLIPVGTTVPSTCSKVLQAKFPNLDQLMNCYGQTETGLMTSGPTLDKLGFVSPNTTLKIVDPETGRVCQAGEHGEICAKTDVLTLGYLNSEEQNKQLFDSEGFLRTGDIGYYKENGDLFYVERMKGLMKYKNNHVSPAELEDVLQSHPAVLESLVFGLPDPQVQELFSAAVVLKTGHNHVTEEDLKDFVNDRVIEFKKLRGPVIFTDSLPRTALGKLKRRDMKAWVLENSKS